MYLCKQNLGFIGFFMHNANLTISVAFKTSRQITSLKHSKVLRYTIWLFCASNGNYSSVKPDRLSANLCFCEFCVTRLRNLKKVMA